ncbi:MAG: FAD:protein FMN transferase [Oscillospiraceae bacterium]|nr:FAD:protein FMN transferase [Oscillospiraceae bacterium]
MKLRIMPGVLISAVLLTSCSVSRNISRGQSFSFDTLTSVTVCSKNSSSKDILDAVQDCLSEMSDNFSLCYDTDADALPENGLYTDCIADTKALDRLYGDKINITCGALTGLWGISTDSPRVPVQEEITEALALMTDTDYPENTSDFPEGVKLDFGAVAKGYALDRIYEALAASEDTDYAVVSLSSSTLLYGQKPGGEKFHTAVTDPDTGTGYLGIIETEAAFISTSGGSERFFEADGQKYCHILDTKTGYPAETDLASVTVIVPADTPGGGIKSDFLSTLIYIEGSGELEKWLACEDIRIIAADANGAVYTSCGGFTLDESSKYKYG